MANQLKLPAGLDNVTLAGTLNNGVTKFTTSTAVLNIPDSGSRVFGRLHGYMGGGSIYHPCPRSRPSTRAVAIPSSGATTVSVSSSPRPTGVAKLKVSYAPVLTASPSKSATKAARVEKPRQVILIPRAEKDAEPPSKLPTLLRHSLSEHLDRLGKAG